MNESLKAAVTVSEMARMVGLSRARFYQLIGTAFPHPVYDVRTRRPIYVEDLQKVCLEVRQRNCGVDGRPVLFYAKGFSVPKPAKPRKAVTPKAKEPQHPEVLAAVRALGLTATSDEVTQAVKHLYPNGLGGVGHPQVIRAVFLHLQRRDRAGSVGQ
jgi:hypothetical protein